MKKSDLISYLYLVCIFIPYVGVFQYISHMILLGTVLIFHNYYKVVPILLLYGYGIVIFTIQLLVIQNDVFLPNYTLSILYAPLLVILFSNNNLFEVSIDLDRIIKITFFAYGALLFYQAVKVWWTPESVGGVHGIIKGPHLNAQLFLLMSGFYLFKKGTKNLLTSISFLFFALLCDYNLATIVYFLSIFAVIFSRFNFKKEFFKYAVVVVIILGIGFYALSKIAEERNYLFTMVSALAEDYTYSGKIGYNINYFYTFIFEEFPSFLFGFSPGNGGSRVALLLTDNYIKFKIPTDLVSEPYYTKEYVYPYLYNVSNVARGTINQPFSSLIAILTEFGLIVGLGLIVYWRNYTRTTYNLGVNKYSHYFLSINFIAWFLLSHSLELLPFVVLYQLLRISDHNNE